MRLPKSGPHLSQAPSSLQLPACPVCISPFSLLINPTVYPLQLSSYSLLDHCLSSNSSLFWLAAFIFNHYPLCFKFCQYWMCLCHVPGHHRQLRACQLSSQPLAPPSLHSIHCDLNKTNFIIFRACVCVLGISLLTIYCMCTMTVWRR